MPYREVREKIFIRKGGISKNDVKTGVPYKQNAY